MKAIKRKWCNGEDVFDDKLVQQRKYEWECVKENLKTIKWR